jgi:hypothetical protein
MKKALVLIGIFLFVNTVFGQSYIITYIRGNVYHDGRLLKLHDRLDGIAQITSNDKTAELALFSAQKGKFRLNFVDSKPVSASQSVKKSELYQLVVGNYLLGYTTEKTLTTRGDFDLETFFNAADTGKNGKNIYLLAGELLPVKSQSATFGPDDKFFICTVRGRDTICCPIRRNNRFLIFDDDAMQGIANPDSQKPWPVSCFIKRSYIFNNQLIEEHFSGPVNITFLTAAYLQDLSGSFKEGMASYYQNDTNKLAGDIEEQLTHYYGRSFDPAVRQVLKGDLK